jgi:hypothetical protein
MSWNKAHAPVFVRAFQRHQEHDVKHPGSVDFIITKQSKLPSFIDGCELASNYVSSKKIPETC